MSIDLSFGLLSTIRLCNQLKDLRASLALDLAKYPFGNSAPHFIESFTTLRFISLHDLPP